MYALCTCPTKTPEADFLLLSSMHNGRTSSLLTPSLRTIRANAGNHARSLFQEEPPLHLRFHHHAPIPTSQRILPLRGRVRVHLSLAAGHGDVYETAGVDDSLLRAALGGLLLLLGLDLLG